MRKIIKEKITASIILIAFCLSLVTSTVISVSATENQKAFYENEATIQAVSEHTEVYLGGVPFGIKFYTEGITIVGFSQVETDSENKSPAYNAGLREYDIIICADSKPISSAKDFIEITENSNGKEIAIDYKRTGEIYSTSFTPVLCKNDGKYKTGMWIKDSTAGIGTLTYIIPSTKGFAGLGHSICDSKTGELLKLTKGVVMNVDLTGVEKGTAGKPGELKGSFSGEKKGTLIKNCNEGIYGVFSELPAEITENNIIETASEYEITEGEAKIRCTIDETGPCEYTVNLTEIDLKEPTNKNFVIEITDKTLIEKTGGIVQGMSGSPIIQNGKLIGAVTHVFISDPKKGYGISVGNMIKSMPDIIG